MKRLIFVFLFFIGSTVFAAFTEKYVSVAGGGAHNGTTEADAWTFAEMIAAVPAAGSRVNIKAGSYTTGTVTLLGGTAAAPVVYRGYNSTIGDLDNQGRNADGTLNTTNFPTMTITGIVASADWSFWQNTAFTGALSSRLIGGATADNWGLISCTVTNTQNNAAAQCLAGDDRLQLINSDFWCSGAAHTFVVEADVTALIVGCRFRGTDTDTMVTMQSGQFTQCVFWGNSGNAGMVFEVAASTYGLVYGCTFYNLTTAVILPNAVNTCPYVFINNICTDSGKWIDSLYAATANVTILQLNNRTRDVTTLLTGVESIQIGAVTTDTGGASTDFVDATTGNFRPISTAPGLAVGLTPYMDIGSYQIQSSAGGGQKSWSH